MRWTLVDTSWLAHRAYHTVKTLQWEGEGTGVIYGFFDQLRTVCFDPEVKSNRLALCFDSAGSYRKQVYPEYKANHQRPDDIEGLNRRQLIRDQVKKLHNEILPSIGFLSLRQDGLESDDVMAQAASQLEGEGCLMITADSDLWQCITTRNCWYDPQRRKYYDHTRFWAEYGLDPEDWVFVKAIAGDKSDNIKGIKGVGEKGAIEYVANTLHPESRRFRLIKLPVSLTLQKLNLGLIKLPHDKTQPVKLREPEYDAGEFFKWAERLGFKTMVDGPRRASWERFFNGDFGNEPTPRSRGEARTV